MSAIARKITRAWIEPFKEFANPHLSHWKLGLMTDDLLPMENELVKEAFARRASKQDRFDALARIRRATAASTNLESELDDKTLWIDATTDKPWLRNHVMQVQREQLERQALDKLDAPPAKFLRRNKLRE